MTVSVEEASEAIERDAFLNRIVQSCLGVFQIAGMYLGERLGLYRSLADHGAATARQLADRTELQERYVREWLEQQTVNGILRVENPDAAAEVRRYVLPAGHAEILLDEGSLNYLGSYPRQIVSSLRPLPELMTAFRRGGGVAYESYGADCRDGIAAGNRVQFINLLGSEWLPRIPELHARLRANPPARVADIGCGFGWSSISIARAYPLVSVNGFDLDASSIEAARHNATEAGVEKRTSFELADAAQLDRAQAFDLVVAFETIHDMAKPVEALEAMGRLVTPDGFVLVVDENVGETFTADPGDIERLYYGFSLLHCLPAGMASQPSAGTGTVMRPSVLSGYAEAAGFREVRVLPIPHDFWRFYQLIR